MENIITNTDITHLKSIGVNNIITNCVFVGEDIIIGNNCTLIDCFVSSGTMITDSYMEKSSIGKYCSIGPYARIRPDTYIRDNCKIGNFVEIKNSQIGSGSKISHLTYVGDAIIGSNVNLGCGVVFCNYNGINKNVSIIGDNCFIGSNVNIIAPVKIQKDTYVCAGTTITSDTNEGDFVIGRTRAEIKQKYKYYLKNKRKS